VRSGGHGGCGFAAGFLELEDVAEGLVEGFVLLAGGEEIVPGRE